MPELPEVETVRRGLELELTGRLITSVDQRRADLRFPFPDELSKRLSGRKVLDLTRRAKYLVAALEGGDDLIVHLGMTGRITVMDQAINNTERAMPLGQYAYDVPADARHDHLVVYLDSGRKVVYNDPRRFGFVLLMPSAERDQHPLFSSLGVEPLSDAFDAAYLSQRASGKIVNLKQFLMDQKIVAGLGNIYVSEALFRAGLSPNRHASSLSGARGQAVQRAERLVSAVKDVLALAICAGGSTLRDYRHADGSSGGFQNEFQVYGRDGLPCLRNGCGGVITRTVHSGRATFACSKCQR